MFRVLSLVLVLSASVLFAACGTANTTPLPPLPFKMTVRDDKFEPNQVSGTVNQPIELTIENQGTKPHSFVIDELNVKTAPIAPGKTAIVTVLSKQIRTYSNGGAFIFYSDVADDKNNGLTGNIAINP